jgi:DNA polymerase-3 subunit gamma/tau
MPESMAAMSSRMKNMIPKISTFPDIELLMDNQILLDQMQAIKGRIRSTLVKSLHNANIQLTMRLARADEVKRILTKRELFDEMRTKNPAIEKMRELLGLEMS